MFLSRSEISHSISWLNNERVLLLIFQENDSMSMSRLINREKNTRVL